MARSENELKRETLQITICGDRFLVAERSTAENTGKCWAERSTIGLEMGERELCRLWRRSKQHKYVALWPFAKSNLSRFDCRLCSPAIFGESAGGSAVHYHMVSELSKGLFHKAIAMSGTVHAPWALSPMLDLTKQLAKMLGWNGEGDDKACLAVIQNSTTESIIKAQASLLLPRVS